MSAKQEHKACNEHELWFRQEELLHANQKRSYTDPTLQAILSSRQIIETLSGSFLSLLSLLSIVENTCIAKYISTQLTAAVHKSPCIVQESVYVFKHALSLKH